MEHFIKRLSATIVDFVVVFLLISLVNNILFVPLTLLKVSLISAIYPYIVTVIVTMAYFTLMEAKTNKTIGKKIMKLYVSDEEGYVSYFSAFVRNITKCFWIPLVFDVIIGRLLNFPSRLFDKLAGTDVYADDELEAYAETEESKQSVKTEDGMDSHAIKEDIVKTSAASAATEKVTPADKKETDDTLETTQADDKIIPESDDTKSEVQNTEQSDDGLSLQEIEEKIEAKFDESKLIPEEDNTEKVSSTKTVSKKEKESYDDEFLDLNVEEESDSFVELTKDDI